MSSDSKTPEPFVVKMGEGEKTIIGDEQSNLLVRRLATAGQTDREFGLIEFAGVKGTGAPPHRHGAEAEAFYIVEGTVRVKVGDIDHLAQVGDFIYIPKNERHKFTIESEFGRLLCLITPGTGFEDLFLAIGEPTTGGYPPNREDFRPHSVRDDLIELRDRYHSTVVDDW